MIAAAPGPLNLITDVAGVAVGSAEDEALRTGTTVILAAERAPGAADVRGGGPGTREIEVLAAENAVAALDAVVLSGGSALGLGAADAVAAELSRRGRGIEVRPGAPRVPIVPAAILYDLGPHMAEVFAADGPPHPRLGRAALAAAGTGAFRLGSAGAGRGAMAGRLKGGLGSASLRIEGAAEGGGAITVGAVVAANPVGSVVMADGRSFWAWPFERRVGGVWEFGGVRPGPEAAAEALLPPGARLAAEAAPGGATVIAAVATDAALSAADCRRIAMMAQDGIARAVVPAHTPMDGDTVFAFATGRAGAPAAARAAALALLGAAAAETVARALARGVHAAAADPDGPPAWRDVTGA